MKNVKNMKKYKVAIIGLGYVGLPLALATAKNHQVIGFDISNKIVEKLLKAISPFQDVLVEKELKLKNKNIKFTNDIIHIKDCDIFIIAVPTPVDASFLPDFSPLIEACKSVAISIKESYDENSSQELKFVIIESTINPGVCQEIVIPTIENYSNLKCGKDFSIAHCPERINPGDKKWNVNNIPRNIGASDKKTCKELANFYRSILDKGVLVNEMENLKEVEATKIIENTFRDINIAYVNELAKSFDILDINLINVINGASNKPFAFMPHYPSCGVGGHCIAVDPYYLIEKAKSVGFDHKFLTTARSINNSMPSYTVEKMIKCCFDLNMVKSEIKVLILGLSYKANVSDTRESPSLKIIQELDKIGLSYFIYDPYITDFNSNLQVYLKSANVIILATNHKEFKNTYKQLGSNIKLFVDGKNALTKDDLLYLKSKKIKYTGIGIN
jgi:UDP-N-acetyl-D-glucosamine dehydrogenase